MQINNKKLKEIRLAQGLTIRKLSELSGVESATICVWEQGKHEPTSWRILWRVCRALFIGVDDIALYPIAHGKGKLGARMHDHTGYISHEDAYWLYLDDNAIAQSAPMDLRTYDEIKFRIVRDFEESGLRMTTRELAAKYGKKYGVSVNTVYRCIRERV